MSDRTAAGIFASVFDILSNHVETYEGCDRVVRSVAKQVVELMREYDFHPAQMESDTLNLCELEEELGVDFGIDCDEEEK